MTTLLDGQDERPARLGRRRVGEAVESRAEVFQAQGMVMVQLGVTLAEALARMRAYAYAENRPLGDVARDVVRAACDSTGTTHEPHIDHTQKGREAVMTTVSAERLARVFVEVADTLVDEFDLIDFLHMLADRIADLVDASAVGLLLADQRGRLEFMAASDENTKLLELFQVQNSEGPCLDAFRTAAPVINADLADASCPVATLRAPRHRGGYRSVHAFPLRLRNEVIGALNVFGSQTGQRLDEADVPIVQALADIAAIGLLQERAIRRGEVLTEQLQGALNSRIVIEQAKGAIAQAHGVSVDEAFTMIRGYARRTNRRLVEVAHAIVTDPTALSELAKP